MQNKSFHSKRDNLPRKGQRHSRGYAQQLAAGLIVITSGVPTANAATYPGNPNQQAVAGALGRCITTNANSLLCNDTFQTTNPSNIKSLTPDQIFSMGSMATRINSGKNTQPSDYANLKRLKRKGGGAGDEDFSKLNIWGKVDNDFGVRNTTWITGFDYDSHNFVAGADYRLQDNWVVGSLFSYRHGNASFDGHRGETTNDNYTGGLYTTYNITDALHVEATASYGGTNYDTRRNINLTEFGSSVAKGSTGADQYAFSWGGGYDFNFQSLTIAPYARGDYMNVGIDSYTEYGSVAAMQFGKQNIQSMISTAGVQTSYTFSFPWGVLIPQLRGEWHHQFLDGQRHIQARFAADPSVPNFNLTGGFPTRNYYTFGAEVSTVLPGGVSAFLAYESLQGYADFTSNKLMLGGRLEF